MPLAVRAGLTENELDAIRSGVLPQELDAAVLAAVDELHSHTVVTDETWCRLADHLDEQQLMDLVFTAGGYGTLAMAIESFGIEDEA